MAGGYGEPLAMAGYVVGADHGVAGGWVGAAGAVGEALLMCEVLMCEVALLIGVVPLSYEGAVLERAARRLG